jgi:hypothetical protein
MGLRSSLAAMLERFRRPLPSSSTGGESMRLQVRPGAIISWPGGDLVVTEAGSLSHTGGWGPVQLRAWQVTRVLKPGDMLNTPFGQCEIIAKPLASPTPAIAQ